MKGDLNFDPSIVVVAFSLLRWQSLLKIIYKRQIDGEDFKLHIGYICILLLLLLAEIFWQLYELAFVFDT